MGSPRRNRKKYSTPRILWDKARILEENKLLKGYGLRRKRELWREKAYLEKVRTNARKLLAKSEDERAFRETELLNSLRVRGLLADNTTLEDVLSLTLEDVLERRLETLVWKKGMARTPKQARQFIVHGHIGIDGQKVTVPSYKVRRDEEGKIMFIKKPAIVETIGKDTIDTTAVQEGANGKE